MRETTVELSRLLFDLVLSKESPTGNKRLELDAIDVLSLLRAASWNVNFMLLDRFLRELAFEPTREVQRAYRVSANVPVVALISEFTRSHRRGGAAHLVFAECGRYRVSAAFLENAAAFVRLGEVFTYPVLALDEGVIAGSSLFAVMTPRHGPATRDHRLPPAA